MGAAAERIANEVRVGYSGETYLYDRAKARAGWVAAPFAAVKDVTILSAMAGDVLTPTMIAAALPVGQALNLATHAALVMAFGLHRAPVRPRERRGEMVA